MLDILSRRVPELGLQWRRWRLLPGAAGRRSASRGGLSESGRFTSEAKERGSAGIGADPEAEQAEDSERGDAAGGAAGQFFEKGGIFGIPDKGQILSRMEILEEKTAEAQVKLFSGVDILVSAHGAGLSNVIFMVPNSYVIELMPPYWDWACYRRLSENTDMQYRMIRSTGKKGPECEKNAMSRLCREKGIRDRDFNADIDKVVDTVRSAIEEVFRMKYKVLEDFLLFCWK